MLQKLSFFCLVYFLHLRNVERQEGATHHLPSSSLAAAKQPPSSHPTLRPAARTHIKENCTRSLSPWRLRISAGFLCSLTVESIFPVFPFPMYFPYSPFSILRQSFPHSHYARHAGGGSYRDQTQPALAPTSPPQGRRSTNAFILSQLLQRYLP